MSSKKHVAGKNKGNVMLYALSTCIWCRKTKDLLNTLGVEYDYIDVDLLEEGVEKEHVTQEIDKWNPSRSFPIMIINNEHCISGYNDSKIREILGK